MPRIEATDFFSDKPPERIIGSECEYTVQGIKNLVGDITPPNLYCSPKAVAAAGYTFAATEVFNEDDDPALFLDNGGKLYTDIKKFVEYCTPESYGPREATDTDMAGILVVRRVVTASGFEHRGVSRRTGYAHTNTNYTTGYHENYLIPRQLCNREYLYKLLPTFLATKVWGGNGAVGPGYELSQKYRGIGDTVVTETKNQNRTTEGKKPMVFLRDTDNYDIDVNPAEQWARCEVRFADANISPLQTYIGFAATSLVLRLCEHDSFISTRLEDAMLSDPVASAREIAEDPTLTTLADNHGGDNLTAIDIQKRFLVDIQRMASYIKLPKSELDAINVWEDWLNVLTAIQLRETDWSALSGQLDVAAKYSYLARAQSITTHGISSENIRAVRADLLWEQVLPEGFGLRHWRKIMQGKGLDYFSPERINRYINEPPRLTRAHDRTRAITSDRINIIDIDWAQIRAFHTSQSGGKIKQTWAYPFSGRR